ncbi:MAG: potassium channel family protein [Thermomicrobiaceae bacterium]
MTLLLVALGVVLIAFAVYDIFETLLDPEDQGRLTDWVSWITWKICRKGPLSFLVYAGPIAYVAVLGSWAVLVVIGGALIYLPFLPESFVFSSNLVEDERTGFLTAIYLSFVTFSTLGYGDITPTAGWLRLVGPAQSLIGFFLLSAAITWILAIYGDIGTRRNLAHETTLLMETLENRGIHLSDLPSETIENLLGQMTSRLVNLTGSLEQFPITYYFRITDDRQSLAVMVLFLCELSDELSKESLPKEVRLQAGMLSGALDHFAESLQGRFLTIGSGASTRELLEAYAADHRRTIHQPSEDC